MNDDRITGDENPVSEAAHDRSGFFPGGVDFQGLMLYNI